MKTRDTNLSPEEQKRRKDYETMEQELRKDDPGHKVYSGALPATDKGPIASKRRISNGL